MFELSQTLLDTTEFRTEARKIMRDLVERWGETTHLAVLVGVEAVYLEKLQPVPAVRILISRTGSRLPAYCTGLGKVLLAYEDWEGVAAQLAEEGMLSLTPNTISGPEDLANELVEIRKQGYAYDREENSIGLCCAAAPIRDGTGEVVAAMSLSAPAFRFYPNEEHYTTVIVEAAQRVSETVRNGGYRLEKDSIYDRRGLQRA